MTHGPTGATKLVSAPPYPAVDFSIAKNQFLRVDHDDDDELIEAFLLAAERHAETFTGRAFVDQTWDLFLNGFPDGAIEIPKPPLIEIVGVFYADGGGSEQEVPATDFIIDQASDPARLVALDAWPVTSHATTNPVRIRFRAGYVDNAVDPPTGEVPEDIRAAIKLYLQTLYDRRMDIVVGDRVDQMPWGCERLLRPHRIWTALA